MQVFNSHGYLEDNVEYKQIQIKGIRAGEENPNYNN